MNTKYNELEDRYEVDPQSIVRSELLNVETPNKYVTYAGLERAVKNVLSKAKDYDKGLVGGYNGSFPLTAATKGNIYLLPATKKYYVCITDYSGSQLTAPNANFEELSVYTNRSKLDNLKAKYIYTREVPLTNPINSENIFELPAYTQKCVVFVTIGTYRSNSLIESDLTDSFTTNYVYTPSFVKIALTTNKMISSTKRAHILAIYY